MKKFLLISVFYVVLFNLVQLASQLLNGGAYHFDPVLGLSVPVICASISYFEGRRKAPDRS